MLWYRNGVKIRQALAVMSGIDFAHKKRVLSIRNATYDDSGSYQCRANNGIGVTRSSRLVNVTVQGQVEHHKKTSVNKILYTLYCTKYLHTLSIKISILLLILSEGEMNSCEIVIKCSVLDR